MLFIPLPFVVALLLLILLVQATRRVDAPSGRLFIALIAIYAVLSVLIGLRWGYGLRTLLPVQSVLAAGWASLAWLSFRGLADGRAIEMARDWPHLAPGFAILVLVVLWPAPIDLALIAIYLGYGLALLRLSMAGADALQMVRLDEALLAYRALVTTAAALIVFALIDLLISIDIRFLDGSHSAAIVAIANLPALLVLGFAASIAGRSEPSGVEIEPDGADLARPEPENPGIIAALDNLMRTKAVFRDFDLNLDRLARKTGIPGRRISRAINQVAGKNVSQYVNDFRIDEACRLLGSSGQPVTEIMFEAGFQTKSNFNREFRRVTGTSPKDWRSAYPDVGYRPGENS